MSRLILEPTSQAQWQTLVHEAQTACDRNLDETLESYLVFLLMRFADKPECTARIMAEDYLKSQQYQGAHREEHLREVGDHCPVFRSVSTSGGTPPGSYQLLRKHRTLVLPAVVRCRWPTTCGTLRTSVRGLYCPHGYPARHA